MQNNLLEEDKDRQIKNLENHINSTKEIVAYSIKRFDTLIISLSTGGLVLSVGFVKDLIDDFEKTNLCLLKLSWLLFALAIISNLLSQVTSYFSNKIEIKLSKNEIRQKRGKEVKVNMKRLKRFCTFYDFSTRSLNVICFLSLIAAIITLILYINFNI